MLQIPRITISAPRGGSGKTGITAGIAASFRAMNLNVQCFKKGPDFIDPMWLKLASGHNCYSLDRYLFEDRVKKIFYAHSRNKSMSIIEGNHGLFDSVDSEGLGSTAFLARSLSCPVILVVDASRSTRSLIPLVQGFLGFEPETNIQGIIFNNVSGHRHESRILESASRYLSIKILGCIPRVPDGFIEQRYLGLLPATESEQSLEIIKKLENVVTQNIDLINLIDIANSAPNLENPAKVSSDVNISGYQSALPGSIVKSFTVAYAFDEAFHFYYPENLKALEDLGAELIRFSPMRDKCLPNADLYYFGGGFPELYAEQLGGNLSMLESLRQSASKGAPIYAECGGMIYLTKGISVTDHYYPLADLLPAKTQMTKMPVGRGYVEFDITSSSIENSPWRLQSQKNIKAHEFHYSKLIDLDPDLKLNYSMSKGVGIDSGWDGWIHDSIFASYVHIHSESAPWWADLLKQTARFWQKK